MRFFSSLTVVLLLLIVGNGYTQPTARQRIIYRMEHVRFKEDPGFRYTEDFSLYTTGNVSLFRSRTKEVNDSLNRIAFEKMVQTGSGEMVMQSKPNTNEAILLDSKLKQAQKGLTIKRQDYVVDLAYPEISWQKKVGQKKTILGYTCMQATGNWGGRQYTVWYAPTLGGSAGPWKLHGLPGTILEAYDTHREVVFTATAIQPLKTGVEVAFSKKSIKATEADIAKLLAAGSAGGYGGSNSEVQVTGVKIEGGGGSTASRNMKITNPLELQ